VNEKVGHGYLKPGTLGNFSCGSEMGFAKDKFAQTVVSSRSENPPKKHIRMN
jgi:hypothetical protein